jgi:HEAT repeat protein
MRAIWLLALLPVWLVAPALGQTTRTLAEWQRELRDPSPEVRARAAEALAAFDQRAVPALTTTLGDAEYQVRVSAAQALVRIGPGLVVPAMIDALRSKEVPIRANAAVVLGAFGPAAKSAVPALASALKDPHARVRELAAEAMDRVLSTDPTVPVVFPMNCH